MWFYSYCDITNNYIITIIFIKILFFYFDIFINIFYLNNVLCFIYFVKVKYWKNSFDKTYVD